MGGIEKIVEERLKMASILDCIHGALDLYRESVSTLEKRRSIHLLGREIASCGSVRFSLSQCIKDLWGVIRHPRTYLCKKRKELKDCAWSHLNHQIKSANIPGNIEINHQSLQNIVTKVDGIFREKYPPQESAEDKQNFFFHNVPNFDEGVEEQKGEDIQQLNGVDKNTIFLHLLTDGLLEKVPSIDRYYELFQTMRDTNGKWGDRIHYILDELIQDEDFVDTISWLKQHRESFSSLCDHRAGHPTVTEKAMELIDAMTLRPYSPQKNNSLISLHLRKHALVLNASKFSDSPYKSSYFPEKDKPKIEQFKTIREDAKKYFSPFLKLVENEEEADLAFHFAGACVFYGKNCPNDAIMPRLAIEEFANQKAPFPIDAEGNPEEKRVNEGFYLKGLKALVGDLQRLCQFSYKDERSKEELYFPSRCEVLGLVDTDFPIEKLSELKGNLEKRALEYFEKSFDNLSDWEQSQLIFYQYYCALAQCFSEETLDFSRVQELLTPGKKNEDLITQAKAQRSLCILSHLGQNNVTYLHGISSLKVMGTDVRFAWGTEYSPCILNHDSRGFDLSVDYTYFASMNSRDLYQSYLRDKYSHLTEESLEALTPPLPDRIPWKLASYDTKAYFLLSQDKEDFLGCGSGEGEIQNLRFSPFATDEEIEAFDTFFCDANDLVHPFRNLDV